jgi:excisionase family DNA binding protein
VTPRERLAAVLAPELLTALEQLVEERVDERLQVLSAKRMAARQRPELLSVPEAAELLRCERQRIYDLLSSGRLTRLKDGARVLVRRSEIERHLAGER